MPIQFSRVIASHAQGNGRTFSVKAIQLSELGRSASPLLVLDEFRVTGRPFTARPHAGFAFIASSPEYCGRQLTKRAAT